jgi:hypothetical protein
MEHRRKQDMNPRKRIKDEDVEKLRNLPIPTTLRLLGLYYKLDREYQPVCGASRRVNISVSNSVFEVIVTGDKWFDLRAERGGGGSIDLTMHLFKEPFDKAVRRLQNKLKEVTT